MNLVAVVRIFTLSLRGCCDDFILGSPSYAGVIVVHFYFEDYFRSLSQNPLQSGKLNFVLEEASFGNEQLQQNTVSQKLLSSTSDITKNALGILPYIKLMKTFS